MTHILYSPDENGGGGEKRTESVVQMWNWILEEGLEDFDGYAQYGLPLFKATAEQYGFPNPIGEKTGSEYEYSSDYDG